LENLQLQKSDISPRGSHECTTFYILRYDKLVVRRHRKEKHLDTHDQDKEYKKELKNRRLTEGE